MATGATNGEIAERLGLSLEGAKWHVREIFSRLDVESREAAIEWWQSRPRRSLAWAPLTLVGAGAAAAAAVSVGTILLLFWWSSGGADSSPASDDISTPTAAAPTPTTQLFITHAAEKPQPALKEAAVGNGWRLLIADDGLRLPPPAKRLLAVGYDQDTPFVDVLGDDGRIAVRVETGYSPMARLNPATGDLLISDWSGPTAADIRPVRLLAFDIVGARLVGEVVFAEQRLDFTIPGSAVYVSADGRWFYWIEHGLV